MTKMLENNDFNIDALILKADQFIQDGSNYLETKCFAEAKYEYRRALDILRKISFYVVSRQNQEDNNLHILKIADCVDGLAATYLGRSMLARAEKVFERALEIRMNASGQLDHSLVKTLRGLAQCKAEMAKYSEASYLFEWALELDRSYYGFAAPEIVSGLVELARLHENFERYRRAEACYLDALNIIRGLPTGLIDSASYLSVNGAYSKLKTRRDVEPLLKRIIALAA